MLDRLTVKMQILLADYRLTVKHVLDLLYLQLVNLFELSSDVTIKIIIHYATQELM